MEAHLTGIAGIAHNLEVRSTAIKWSSETRAPVERFGSCLDHLSSDFHEALCRLGAKLFEVARRGAL